MHTIVPPLEEHARAAGLALAAAITARDRTAVTQALVDLGAAAPGAAASDLLALAAREPLEHCVLALARAWDQAADPEMALRGFQRLAEEPQAVEALAQLGDARAFAALHSLLGGSAFLTTLLARHPEWLGRFLVDVLEPGPISADDMKRRALAWLGRDGDLDRAVRFTKGETYLRIAARDLAGFASLDETVTEITHLAEALLSVAVTEIQRVLETEHGAPASADATRGGDAPPGFVVLGMGKLGGRELNFSSDIDLIYLFHSDLEETLGNENGTGQIPVGKFFTRLGERLTLALSRATDDGFAMRVDLRLRPMGTSGAVAHSLRNALVYYEAYGRTWERAALLKARPVAGNRALGEAFLKAVEPFVYRRYLDYSTVEDMKEMKRRIDVGLAPGGEHIRNVKLGKGGIREIEFVVQTLALINAGKDRRIRVRGSIEALPLLVTHGYLSPDDHGRLDAAYVFLRHLEHRIQIVTERQSHRLPTDREELRLLARRMGYRRGAGGDPTDAFVRDLEAHRSAVSAIFRTFFHEAEGERTRRVRPEVRALFDTPDIASVEDAQLAALGFDNVAAARHALTVLREGPPKAPTTSEAKARLDRVAPLLMEEAASSPQPDLALAHLERFLNASGARSATSLLAENPTIARLLMRLFSSSVFLSEILISHPELIDGLIRAGAAGPTRARADLAADLAERLRQADDDEEVLEVLRVFRTEETLRIGFHDLVGTLDLEALTLQLSDLAEVCLDAALEWALGQTSARYGSPVGEDGEPARFGVLGMGKLGGREIQYGSDLDLIFLYDPPGSTEGRDRSITNREFFAKVTQRMITALSAVTGSGIVYPIDARLRPSGNAGPLVASLDSFRRYHEGEAALWERQALIKARLVAGDESLASIAAEIRDVAVYGGGLSDVQAAEIRHMRHRMEAERARQLQGSVDLKLGPGGLVDVEFAVQVLLLRHGHDHPGIRRADTLGALEAIEREGLLPLADGEALRSGYLFLRRIENRQRIVHDRATDLFPLAGPELEALASRLDPDGLLGLPATPDELRDEFLRVTAEVRRVFDAIAGPGE
ncbi:MAG: bifunctional [glutamate--ammonia ligase]-adenylyl-L-tyrosine phosphorylase/[glutamate--ammonia-ligase] adenylyltransferase [Deltaproteobacteria bacterium]|nr:bifunctional [glutamate--ammonia ligase]-adenylyl-L-tyrosine phosphorylase/[glutamate--ammonia-ligase] adenylyltransferase [Deltaproteobacteria bacterium]